MKKQMLKLTSFLTISLFIFFAIASGGDSVEISSNEEFQSYLQEKDFYQESNLSESKTLSFDANQFVLTFKNKRSGASRKLDGSYEVKSSKYSDKGNQFYYVKLVFNDISYADEAFFVFRDGNIVEPSNNGVLDKNEDEYGLNIPEWHVSLSPDYNIFEPIDK
jgi:hypothetical protein